MKTLTQLLALLLLSSCATGKEKKYTASTPAAAEVRLFLGIPLADSVDFIRWKLTLNDDNRYSLQCNYGIGKPNTNGFINGGDHIEINGKARKENNIILLYHKSQALHLSELNNNLLHILDDNNHLLVGNGGWSYSLNNLEPVISSQFNYSSSSPGFAGDSAVFDGRTPCGVPGVVPAGKDCYKLKWRVILYPPSAVQNTGTYKILNVILNQQGSLTGNWTSRTGTNGQIIYQLKDEKGNAYLYLLKADENILLFTDANGNLLTGNEDFSYTLNKR